MLGSHIVYFFCCKTFKIQSEKERRSVGGWEMGGGDIKSPEMKQQIKFFLFWKHKWKIILKNQKKTNATGNINVHQ